MTLVELLVATAIGVMMMAGLLSFMVYSVRAFASMDNYIVMDQKSRYALDRFTSVVRQVDGLASISSNAISFNRGGTNITFSYNASAGTLAQVAGGSSSLLLSNVTVCTFGTFARDFSAVTNTFDNLPATGIATNCKAVTISWTCSRRVFGSAVNTELEKSGQVIIRNE